MAAKQRMIKTKFWSDSWVREKLNPLDRYLFLYFLTNEHGNISGVYEISLSTVAFETGIDKEDLIKSMLPRLKPKVYFFDGWVIIPNFVKNQNYTSPKVIAGIQAEINNVPKKIKEKMIEYRYSIDTISHLDIDIDIDLDLDASSSKKKKDTSTKLPVQNLINYFSNQIVELKGFKPEILGHQETDLLRLRRKTYSEDQIKKLIDWFIKSDDFAFKGSSLAACLSTNTINKWLAQKNQIDYFDASK